VSASRTDIRTREAGPRNGRNRSARSIPLLAHTPPDPTSSARYQPPFARSFPVLATTPASSLSRSIANTTACVRSPTRMPRPVVCASALGRLRIVGPHPVSRPACPPRANLEARLNPARSRPSRTASGVPPAAGPPGLSSARWRRPRLRSWWLAPANVGIGIDAAGNRRPHPGRSNAAAAPLRSTRLRKGDHFEVRPESRMAAPIYRAYSPAVAGGDRSRADGDPSGPDNSGLFETRRCRASIPGSRRGPVDRTHHLITSASIIFAASRRRASPISSTAASSRRAEKAPGSASRVNSEDSCETSAAVGAAPSTQGLELLESARGGGRRPSMRGRSLLKRSKVRRA